MKIKINACLSKGQVVNPVPQGVLVVDTGALPVDTFQGQTNIDDACRLSISQGYVDHHTIDMLPGMTTQPKKCATQMVVDYFPDILNYCKKHNVQEIQIHQDSDMDAITAAFLLYKGLTNGKLPECAKQMATIVNKVDYAEYRRPVNEYIKSFPGCITAIYGVIAEEKATDIKSRQAWNEFAELDNKVLAEIFPIYEAIATTMEKNIQFNLDNTDIKSFIENYPGINNHIKESLHKGTDRRIKTQTQFEKDIKTAKILKFNFKNPETNRIEEGQIAIIESKSPLATTALGYTHFSKNTIIAVYAGEDRKGGDMYDIGVASESAGVFREIMHEIAFEMNKSEATARLNAKEKYLALSRTPNMTPEQKALFEKYHKLFTELNALKQAGKTRPGQPGGDLPGIDNIDPTPIVSRGSLIPASNHSLMTSDTFKIVLTNYASRTQMNVMSAFMQPGRIN